MYPAQACRCLVHWVENLVGECYHLIGDRDVFAIALLHALPQGRNGDPERPGLSLESMLSHHANVLCAHTMSDCKLSVSTVHVVVHLLTVLLQMDTFSNTLSE